MDKLFGAICGLIFGIAIMGIVIGIPILFYAMYWQNQRENMLYDHCLADGHKDYECSAMLRRNDTSYPIIVPMVGK